MRIAIGGYCHETNSFSNLPVTRELLTRCTLLGQNILTYSRGIRSAFGGFLDEADLHGITLLPTRAVSLQPCAPTVKDAFEEFRDALVEELWAAHCEAPLDGIALNLHGAGVAEGYDDLEAEILRAVRARFGAQMPIGIELDLHANVTDEMVALCDVMVGYKCYPHVDIYDAGRTLIKLLHRYISTGKRPCLGFVKLPWMIAPAFGLTLSGPGHEVQQFMKAEEVLDASFFHGFSYADVACAGASVVTVAEDQQTADRCAHRIAEFAWSIRHDFAVPTNSAEKAMDLAEQAEYPVVINESSDNPGGGSPGDGTHLLREMLRRDLPGSAFGMIRDEEVVDLALAAGVGSRIDCLLGGKTDKLHGEPIELKGAYVKTVSDGRFVQKNPMGKGTQENYGPSVLLEVGNVSIVVTKVRTQTKDDGPFFMTGLDWRNMRILALKSTHHFRGWWQDQVKTIIPCDSPGIHSADLGSFPFTKLSMDKFPFCEVDWK